MNKVDKTNEKFKNATKAQKRVMIAKDVLGQIKTNRYLAESGTWVEPNFSRNSRVSEICDSPETSIQDTFKDKTIESCTVCALGGLFMSCINLNNNTTLRDFDEEADDLGALIDGNRKLSNSLNRIFTREQLILIEQYFEEGAGYFYRDDDCDLLDSFVDTYPDEQDRLKAIMENIIENKGTFKPEKLKL